MPVHYFGSGLIPAPFATLNKSNVRDNAGNILHPEYTFTLKGTIVNVDNALDSPYAQFSTGMEGVVLEQKRIMQIFSNDGGLLELDPPNFASGNAIAAYCRVNSVSFDPGPWVNRCDYNVVLTATSLSGVNDIVSNIDSSNESWTITENIDSTFSISHQLNAVGAIYYNDQGVLGDALAAARNWVGSRRYMVDISGQLTVVSGASFGFYNILSNINSPSSGNFWNYSCIENPGVGSRSWALTENFIYFSASGNNVREQWNATVNYNATDPRFANVAINGLVVGLGDRNSNLPLRNNRAKSYFEGSVYPNIYSRLANYAPSGYTLNPVPLNRQIGYERTEGNLTYSIGFSAVSGTLIPNAIEETIDIIDNGFTDVFAIIPVPGRGWNGPVIQEMNTYTNPERTVNINAQLAPITGAVTLSTIKNLYLQKPDTSAIIQALIPNSGSFYCKQNVENFSPITRRYSRTIQWLMKPSGQLAQGTPGIINNLS